MPPTGTDEGIRAAARFRTSHPSLGVVVLSQFDDPAFALSLLEGGSGGRAYLLKERVSEPEQLVAAIREVARGGSVIDPRIVETLLSARARVARSPLAGLTPRERDVLATMAEGKSNLGISRSLFISEAAVEKHVTAILRKLEIAPADTEHRRVHAVLLFMREAGRGG
jgi:DNA-binding NarL/FixJ family response regulator